MARECKPMIVFYILTSISLTICFVVFVLSMLDLGYASWWTNLVVPLLTASYHITIITLHHRSRSDGLQPRYKPYPAATTSSIVCIYVLGALWFIPFGIILGRGMLKNKHIYAGNPATIGIQYGLDSAEFGMLCGIAGVSFGLRRQFAKNRALLSETKA